MGINKRIAVAAVGLVVAIVGGVLLVSVVPRYKKQWDDFGRELSPLNRTLLDTSDFIAGYWFMILPGLFLTATAFVVLPLFLGASESDRKRQSDSP